MGDERVDAPSRVIKRYANRKLYDTHASRYVTLHQIAEYVKAGEEVQIVDNTTKEDLTRVTLAQILYERERTRDVPEERKDRSLRDLIREGRERLLDTILEGPMGKLVHRLDPDVGASGASAAGAGAGAGSTGGDSAVAGASPLASDEGPASEAREHKDGKDGKGPVLGALDELGRIADSQWRAILDGALHTVQQLQGEVQRLHSRIEELEGRLGAQLGRAPKKDEEPPGE